jgi:hypothetical protein
VYTARSFSGTNGGLYNFTVNGSFRAQAVAFLNI